jgi:hyperosmotically inducible protein
MFRLIGVFFSGILLALAGCEPEGPAEQAGERIDQAAENVAEEAEALGNEADELAERAADELEEAPQ